MGQKLDGCSSDVEERKWYLICGSKVTNIMKPLNTFFEELLIKWKTFITSSGEGRDLRWLKERKTGSNHLG